VGSRASTTVTFARVLTVSFVGYFALIIFCELTRPEVFGADLSWPEGRAVIADVHTGSPAARAGLMIGDRIVMIEGRPLRGVLDWNTWIARIDFDRPIPIEIARGSIVSRTLLEFKPGPRSFWTSPQGVLLMAERLAQLITLVLAILLTLRSSDDAAQMAGLLLASIGVFSLTLPYRLASVWARVPIALGALFWIPMTSTLVIGGTFFALFALLPRRRRRTSTIALWCLPFLPVAFRQFVFITALVYRPDRLAEMADLMQPIVVLNLAYVVAGVAVLFNDYRLMDDLNERRRMRLIGLGTVCGVAAGVPAIVAYWLGLNMSRSSAPEGSPLVLLGTASFMAMPISFWWAIGRHQLFDIKFVVRRSVRYIFARHALLALGPALAAMIILDGVWHGNDPLSDVFRRHALVYGAAVAVFALCQWRRAPWLETIDRHLFRERYDACVLLRSVAALVRTRDDLAAVAQPVIQQVDSALHPEWVGLFVRAADDDQFETVASLPMPCSPWPARTRLLDFLRALQKPLAVAVSDTAFIGEHLPQAELQNLASTRARLIVPVTVGQNVPEAIIVLGGKRSEEPFDREDKELLSAVGESLQHLVKPFIDARRGWRHGLSVTSPRVDAFITALVDGTDIEPHISETVAVGDPDRRVLKELAVLARLGNVHRQASTLERVSRTWGPFLLKECVGRGSFGIVYRAWDPKLEREVAIKLFEIAASAADAFLTEGRLLARVDHPNVVRIYGADKFDGANGLWMEFVQGRTLKEIIQEQGVLSDDEATALGGAICRALAAVHGRGLVHGDVKAQNVMRERGGRIVLMDFGAGGRHGPSASPRVGTPLYMAPELFEGAAPTPAADVYSVGVLLFHLVTGSFPVLGATYEEVARHHARDVRQPLRDLRPDLADGFIDVVDRALARDVRRRIASAGALETAMRSV
jgi:protein kinase-like protein/PDZ domain-containing protein